MKALAIGFAALPFAFGMIRAFKTGTDLRYVWVALAAMMGGIIATAVVRRLARPPGTAALVVAVFVASGVLAVVTAMLLGTQIGPGLLIVAGSFAACFAAATSVATASAKR
jgi:uncharacterized membrane protein HdeD (DUF308 family)